MSRLLLRPAVALATFVISLVLTWAMSSLDHTVAPKPNPGQETVRAFEQERREYKTTLIGDGLADGFPASFTSFENTDGMKFSRCIIYYRSARQANQKMREKLKGADIISRELGLDENGKKVGEKVILQYRSNFPYDNWSALVWTNGPSLTTVDSSSLENILEYVKDSKR